MMSLLEILKQGILFINWSKQMIEQIIQDLYAVINKYPNNEQEVLAAIKGTLAAHEYTVALKLYEGQSAMALNQLLGGQNH